VLLSVGAWFLTGCDDSSRLSSNGRATQALGQNLGAESEPNANASQATPIGGDAVVRANAMPNGDVDFFRISAEPGTRIYAATATAFSTASDVGDNDSQLDLIDTNGTTVLESDDDSGSISTFSSSIAGARLAARGSYYLRVRGTPISTVRQQLRPYDLHVRLRSGSPVAETEPNDSIPTAKALPDSGWVSGETNDADDVDFFSLGLAAGDTVFVSLDLDPERDAVWWDALLRFGEFAGTLFTVDEDGGPSKTLAATVERPGTYYVGVESRSGQFGTYHLSVSVHPATAGSSNCTTYTSADAPKSITDAGRTLSTITVPGSPRIEDLDVSLQLSHANPEDLDVHLRSPAGNDNALFTDVGSSSFPDIDLSIDDEAAFPLTPSDDYYFQYVGDTALAGLGVQPETSSTDDPLNPGESYSSGSRLWWFDGENAGGTWTLVLDDDRAGSTGSLQGWAITVCEPPALTCPNGSTRSSALSADFESGTQGFTTSGTLNQWARGTPTGPATFVGCNGGTQCWKTNLTGNYAASSTSNLISPAIDLTNAVAPITLEFAMKYELQSASFDHAWVEVRDMAAVRTQRIWEFSDATMVERVGSANANLNETAGWGIQRIDVSAFAGRTIQVAFHHDADDDFELGGIAIDDVSVTHCSPSGGSGGGGGGGAAGGGAGGAGAGGAGAAGAGSGGVAGTSTGTGGRAQGGTGNSSGAGEGGNGPEGGTGPGTSGGEGGEATGGARQGGTGTGATAGRSGTMGGMSGTSGGTIGEGGEAGEGEGEGGTKPRHASDINTDSTCGCRVPGKSSQGEAPLFLALALGAAALRRRSRR
jgi:MYXO-CTERM domain-containing protein